MIIEKNKYDLEYSKGMKKIFDWNYTLTNEGTLSEGVKSLREYFLQLSFNTSETVNSTKNTIIDPSKKFIEDQLQSGKSIYNEAKKSEKDYKDSINNMEKARIKFNTNCKNAENAKLDSELCKLTYIPVIEREKFNLKAFNALRDAKESERQYIIALNYANAMRQLYIDTCQKVLKSFQQLEEDFIKYTKETMSNYIVYINSQLKTESFEVERVYQQVDKVNHTIDIETYINANKTDAHPPGRIEFIPYQINLRSKPIDEYENYPSTAVYNVICSLSETLEQSQDNKVF
jgi:hypothetical protein